MTHARRPRTPSRKPAAPSPSRSRCQWAMAKNLNASFDSCYSSEASSSTRAEQQLESVNRSRQSVPSRRGPGGPSGGGLTAALRRHGTSISRASDLGAAITVAASGQHSNSFDSQPQHCRRCKPCLDSEYDLLPPRRAKSRRAGRGRHTNLNLTISKLPVHVEGSFSPISPNMYHQIIK